MIKEKYHELLQIMEPFFALEGYQKSRKRGLFQKTVSGKIIKIRMLLRSVRRSGELGEIGAFAEVEYPELEKICAALKGETYKKGVNFFSEDIALFCGEKHFAAFHFTCGSNMEYVSAVIRTMLTESVFPRLRDYEEDEKILDKFGRYDTPWRQQAIAQRRDNIDFYIRWSALCLLNGYLREARLILKNERTHIRPNDGLPVLKERMDAWCAGEKQKPSCIMLAGSFLKINPQKEEIFKALLRLDGEWTYYLILEDSVSGDYLQIAGGSGEYTLEIRLYQGQEYIHYRAETMCEDTWERRILYGVGHMTMQTNQVLSYAQVHEITCYYLAAHKLHSAYRWIIV